MSARVPLVLLVVAALLLGYVLAFERGRPGQAETEARAGLLVQGLLRDRITRVQITSGEQRVVLRREGEGFDEAWTLDKPRESPADPEKVEDYIRHWEFAVAVRTLESPSPEDRAAFGLDSPKGQVTFEMGRAETRVTLASGAPVDGGGYVRVDDGRAISVVGKDVVELFDRTWESFAAKTNPPTLEDLEDSDP